MKLIKSIILISVSSFSLLGFSKFDNQNNNFRETSLSKTIDAKALNSSNENVDRIIVILDPTISDFEKDHQNTLFSSFDKEKIKNLSASYNASARARIDKEKFNQIVSIELSGTQKRNFDFIKETLLKKEGVLSVEKDYTQIAVEPNDPYYTNGEQWGLNGTYGVKANQARGINTGSNDVTVGIIDLGVVNHNDYGSNFIGGTSYAINTAYDPDDEDQDFGEYITYHAIGNHGNAIAGIIGAKGNNSLGISGVAWNVSIYGYFCLAPHTNDTVSKSAAIESIIDATNKWGTSSQIDILNYSIAGFGVDTSIASAVSNYPGLFVWAVGNRSYDVDNNIGNKTNFDLENLISVGALKSNGQKWGDSNFSSSNTNIHIYAPGDNIVTTNSSNGYLTDSGTSLAAPFVAGTAALMLSENPSLSASDIKEVILEQADNHSITYNTSSSSTITQTVKKLNTYKALQEVKHTCELSNCVWKNYYTHEEICYCGRSFSTGHFVDSNWNGSGTTTCLRCGGPAKMGFITASTSYNGDSKTYFGDGSYKHETGIYFLSKSDQVKLANNTLIYPK